MFTASVSRARFPRMRSCSSACDSTLVGEHVLAATDQLGGRHFVEDRRHLVIVAARVDDIALQRSHRVLELLAVGAVRAT